MVAATSAALDYLQFLSEEFEGDWLLAVAAYNCGEANIARAVARNRKAGKPTDFFSLKLPRETRAYVPKLLAMRRIVNDPLVAVTPLSTQVEPSSISDPSAPPFHVLQRTIRQIVPAAIVAPGLLVGATDSRHYAPLTPNIFYWPKIVCCGSISRSLLPTSRY